MEDRMEGGTRKQELVLFKLSGRGLSWYILPFPSCGFVICVILSLMNDFESSTSTHCGVHNYLPSISAAIGGATPQRYIWRICIALHVAPRLMVAIVYYNYYNSFYVRKYKKLFRMITGVNSLLHIVENLCLVGLTYVSSREDFEIHKMFFAGFMLFSQLYMILTLVLFKWSHAYSGMDYITKKSFSWKKKLGVFNICVFIVAMYVYWRHNTYCEPGVYSLFCLCEYLVIASNIIFNGTFTFDMGNFQLQFMHTKEEVRYGDYTVCKVH